MTLTINEQLTVHVVTILSTCGKVDWFWTRDLSFFKGVIAKAVRVSVSVAESCIDHRDWNCYRIKPIHLQ